MRPVQPAAWLALLLGASIPLPGGALLAQEEPDWATPALGEAAFLSLNTLLGGLTAGLHRELSGGSFGEGFARGALGGGLVYAGKRIAAEKFAGAGFLGREVAAVGTSAVRNASRGRGTFERLLLPVGPLHLYVRTGALTGAPGAAGPLVGIQVDLKDLYWTVYGVAERRLAFDLGASLSSGAPVFRADRQLRYRGAATRGLAAGGVIFLASDAAGLRDEVLAHERAHILQADFAHGVWTGPLEEWLAAGLPRQGFRAALDYDVAFGLLAWGTRALGSEVLWEPREWEADFLEER